MQISPLISIILTLYNGEKYMEEAINSVLNQRFTNFELLCVNDGSTDTTLDILQKFANKDPRIKIINIKNGGVSIARNTAIDLALGEYITFLDQDDLLHPQYLEILYHFITTTKSDVVKIKFSYIDENFKLKDIKTFYDDYHNTSITTTTTPFSDYINKKFKQRVAIWCNIYNKKAIEGIYLPPSVQPAEDLVFLLKVYNKVKTLSIADIPLLFYRKHSLSVFKQGITAKYLNSQKLAVLDLYNYFIKTNILAPALHNKLFTYLNKISFKLFVRDLLRLKNNTEIINISLQNLHQLFNERAINKKYLGLKNYFITYLFINKKFILAKVLAYFTLTFISKK